MKVITLIFCTVIFCPIFAQSIKSEQELNIIQKETFLSLMKIICSNVGEKHTYINKLKTFKMIDDTETYVTTYKYLSSEFNFFITIYNTENGIRFNSPNSLLYDGIVENGVYEEVHKEGATSFLVYKFLNQSFLINFSTDDKGRKHYIVDTYCIK